MLRLLKRDKLVFHCGWLLVASTIYAFTLPPDHPRLRWTFSTSGPLIASPVSNGKELFIGGLDSTLYCITHAGKLKWSLPLKGAVRSEAVLHHQNIAFVSGDGSINMVKQVDGSQVWKFSTGPERSYEFYGYADYFYSSPVIDNDVLYVGSGDGNIYSIDAATGKLKWSFKTQSIVHAKPIVMGELLYVGSFDGNFYALNKKSGKEVWKFKSVGQRYFPKGEFQGRPAGDGKRLYVGARDYNLYALDAFSGYAHWNRQFELGWAMGMPLLYDSILYVGTSDDKVLLALDPVSGKTIWQTNLGFNIFGGCAIRDSVIYVGTLMGKVFAIEQKSGQVRWVWNTLSYSSNRKQYFQDDDSYRKDITSVILKGEDFISMYYKLGGIFSTPLIEEKKMFISSTDGNLYYFDL